MKLMKRVNFKSSTLPVVESLVEAETNQIVIEGILVSITSKSSTTAIPPHFFDRTVGSSHVSCRYSPKAR